ncbi:MAG: formate dehydrogenase subunit alpha [Dehalococcoidia bacterium]|nr:formate dehydrogenase subunit alpha [Dehalococcoidia bacterium]
MSVHVTVDGRQVPVAEAATVLDAVLAAGIEIPHLCKEADQPPIGACRTCLVDVDGGRGFPASCHTPAQDGMVVRTRGEALDRIRNGVLALTRAMQLAELAAPVEGMGHEFSSTLDLFQLAEPLDSLAPKPRSALDDSNPIFQLDHEACIMCGRCTTACEDIQHIGAISIAGTAQNTHIAPFMDQALIDSICTTCGQCVSVCPTGALHPKPTRPKVTREVRSVCAYCGVGCGITMQVDETDRLINVLDDPTNQSSQGMLCVKGRFGLTFIQHEDRLTEPLIRKNGVLTEAAWDEALDLVAEKFAEHRGSFGSLASAKATNEDGYVQQKLVRLLMGTNNIDHCTRLCHSPSVEAMIAQLGSGATSNSYEDYRSAGCLMVVGSDTSSNHPVIAAQLRQAIDERGARLIVVNPKRIDLCNYTDLWLRANPGTDVALFNGLARAVLDAGLADKDFIGERTEGFAALEATLADYSPEVVEQITGVPAEDIRRAAVLFAQPPFGGSCLIWGMGITQHTNGTDNASALLNLALVTGQIGKPAAGVSPLRGQNNVQGCGDAGCIPNKLPGYQNLTDDARGPFERVWKGPLPSVEGLVVTDMIEAAAEGNLTCMYITGENPLLSEPYLAHAKKAIENLQFLVVQDIFLHETAELADVVLPATSFAEKEGTFTNSERRVQRVRQAVPPVGNSRPDWWIVSEIGKRLAERLGMDPRQFEYAGPAAIFDELAALTPFMSGLSHERLDREGGIQWPCPTPDHPGTPQLYADSFPVGKAKFEPVIQGPPAAELPSRRFPLILNTGRILYHWHGGTITRRAEGLLARAPYLEVAINPEDANEAGLSDGDDVHVVSRRGELDGKALVTETVHPGEIFIPFVKLQESAANFLTNAVFDPKSKIPEYKVCAVRIENPAAPSRWRRGRRRMGLPVGAS